MTAFVFVFNLLWFRFEEEKANESEREEQQQPRFANERFCDKQTETEGECVSNSSQFPLGGILCGREIRTIFFHSLTCNFVVFFDGFLWRAIVHDFTVVEQNDSVAYVCHQSETVGYDDDGARALHHGENFFL